MYCSKCGKEIDENVKFCSNCGNEIVIFNDNDLKKEMKAVNNVEKIKKDKKINFKEFFTSPKKTAMVGLISSIVMSLFFMNSLFYNGIGIIYTFLYDINTWGFIVYFAIVVKRLYRRKGNIKLANYILILSCLFGNIFLSFVNIIYLVNIFFKEAKIKYVTNKVFAITNILFAICFTFLSEFNLITLIYYMVYLLRIPYFYNYYELLKGEKNGK